MECAEWTPITCWMNWWGQLGVMNLGWWYLWYAAASLILRANMLHITLKLMIVGLWPQSGASSELLPDDIDNMIMTNNCWPHCAHIPYRAILFTLRLWNRSVKPHLQGKARNCLIISAMRYLWRVMLSDESIMPFEVICAAAHSGGVN